MTTEDLQREKIYIADSVNTGNGIRLIEEERRQQIQKHGFDAKQDDRYTENELLDAAICLITQDRLFYPDDWNKFYLDNFMGKPRIDQLAVAGALIAAEIDRIERAG